MKTAISIPDALFRAADRLAKRLGISRSELYARAVDRMVREHDRDGITEALNRVYANEPSGLDPVIARMQSLSLEADDW